jgi:hypothetical protein
VLEPLDHIECRDAVLNADGTEAVWPVADVVTGNPPFVGDKKMRGELGDAYTERLRLAYAGRVPGGADLVCYWFEQARSGIEAGRLRRAELVATNSIRGGRNREVLDRIVRTTRIFEAWSDEPWVNDGAAVRVSLVGFGESSQVASLDGQDVLGIGANLEPPSSSVHAGVALPANAGASFQGPVKVGPFDIAGKVARAWLGLPNPHRRSNAAVLRPLVNGIDVTRRPTDIWIIDFGVDTSEADAMLFEGPFAHVRTHVRPMRMAQRRESRAKWWWLHGETVPGLRRAMRGIERYVVTPRVAKHRTWSWRVCASLPDSAVVAVTRSDDTTFGMLHSRLQALWTLGMCTWLGVGNDPRYTPTTCFETFPFPEGLTPADTAHQRTDALPDGALIPTDLPPPVRANAESIARAAKRLTDLRDAWLNPPEWTERVPEVVPLGMAVSPYSDRIVAKQGHEAELAKRTLTNLYNARPAWLAGAHEALDAAVATAYGWQDYTPAMLDDEVLRRLLALNLSRAPA